MYFSRVKTVCREYTIVRQTDGNVDIFLKLPEELKKKKNICSIRYLEKLLHFLFNFCHFNLSNRINYASRQTFLIQINILRSRVI